MQTYIITNENYARIAENLSGLIFRQNVGDNKHQRIKFVSMKFQNMIFPHIANVLVPEVNK